ncbi:MAG: cofactor-independent phosphoglycerate mutase [Lachnospiraceae bacterium]|jgi:2,3-bisphosphoglycerate-independent phosphoglycerate mutase|nr:cofactor-independent phosphoglycerate mutase [Lachnospiraceae bacterium]MCX4315220.1 cofactor-independent phosphoglycerate mutase [Lachnospiraceae bacterium]
MKYLIVLGDGMADLPIPELGGQTPLAYAKTPHLDRLAAGARIGMVQTIPEGMKPGSDTANLAVLGYDPKKYYTGRSPLEALSIGVPMKDTDIALRCNLVTLTEEEPYEKKRMSDHSSSEISTEDAHILIEAVKEAFADETWSFYTGTSYRHLTIWHGGKVVDLTPPHDILEQQIGDYLPGEEVLRRMMEKSFAILNHHPLNEERAAKGLNKANSIWFWGAGTKPALDSFYEKTGKRGAMISAVDLLKGIAAGSGMRMMEVEGADGTLHTNYEGKVEAAVAALLEEGDDFAYIHVEAPDEMGHQGSIDRKVQSIEYLDTRVIGPLLRALEEHGTEFRLLVLPDHPTPIAVRTHTSDPVPYLLYDSTKIEEHTWRYNEAEAGQSGYLLQEGYRLIDVLLEN